MNHSELDRSVSILVAQTSNWQQTDLPTRLAYLQACLIETVAIADEWTIAACQAKGIDPQSSLYGEEQIIGATSVVRYLRLLKDALTANGKPTLPDVYNRSTGQTVAKILPANLFDRLLWLGYCGEIWLEPDVELTQSKLDRSPPTQVALVLGAGNVSAIAPIDAIHQLFIENRLVILKLNPVNDYLAPYLTRALLPLIDRGFLQIVGGSAKVGAYLCQHPDIAAIHITGSGAVHDAIVWGDTPTEQSARKTANQPLLNKEITSELGCVTPIIIVPGNWSRSDLQFQARHVAASIAHNASFNCAAGQILVLLQQWPQTGEFIDLLRQELRQTPPRIAYYPGTQARYQTFLDRYPQAELLGERTEQTVPWTLIPQIPPVADEYILNVEAFCGILGIVELPAANASEFLPLAVNFVNDRVWGTLSCTIIIDSATQRQHRSIFDNAIADLKYGAIGVNVWSGMLFYLGSTTWGAYPGNSLADIGSGRGIVHNTYLIDRPQKSVVTAPFRPIALPAWFSTHPNLRQLSQALLKFEAKPTWHTLIPTIIAALRN